MNSPSYVPFGRRYPKDNNFLDSGKQFNALHSEKEIRVDSYAQLTQPSPLPLSSVLKTIPGLLVTGSDKQAEDKESGPNMNMTVPLECIPSAKLDQWITHNRNVLFTGKHGIGKTSKIIEAFDRHGLNWVYFSAATMDPWVDFIGIPREVAKEDGQVVLELVKPEHFAYDRVEAILMDEFNRAHKKVRNAVMELIQFKSINGKKFKNLRFVWAATNPAEEGYNVEELDPAQVDRFHVHYKVPYSPEMSYFSAKYGQAKASAAMEWWLELPAKMKDEVSPRRLDYALDWCLNCGGSLIDVLPESSNISKLHRSLMVGAIENELEKLYRHRDSEGATKFLANENNYSSCERLILNESRYRKFFIPLLSTEIISKLMTEDRKVLQLVLSERSKVQKFAEVARYIENSNCNPALVREIELFDEAVI